MMGKDKDALEKIKGHIATLTDKEIVYCQDEIFKRFLVFVYERYYPDGGLTDIVSHFDDIQPALLECIELNGRVWDRIVLFDRHTGEEVDVKKMLGGD